MWDIYKAKCWLVQTGLDHIKDGLFAEGGELLYEAKWGVAYLSEKNFHKALVRICCWSHEDIDFFIKEIMES
jgi:hypothetical protein